MLIQKKIEKGRLTAYIVIITIMVGGMVFAVYKNSSFGRSEEAAVVEVPAETEAVNSNDYNFDKLLENAFVTEEKISQPVDKNVILPAVEADKSSTLIDLSLLSELKFKMLEENILKSQEFETGKNNPFAPY